MSLTTTSQSNTSTLPGLDAAIASREKTAVTLALLFLLFLGLLDVQIISPILPALAADFQTSIAAAGVAVTIYAAAASACALVIGPLSDHFGRLLFLRWAAAFFGLAAGLAWFAPSFPVYLAARLFAGAAGGVISACVIAQIADLFPYEARGRAMGWIGAMYFAAAVVGVPAGAWMAGSWGWRFIYVILVALAIIVAVLLFRRRASFTHALPALAQAPQTEDWSFARLITQQTKAYAHYWRMPVTRRGLLLALAFAATASGLLTYLGAWLNAAFGMTAPQIGLVFLVTGLASTITAFSGGWWSDRFGKRRLIVISSGLLVAVLPGLAHVTTMVQLYLACAAGGVFLALREGPFQALLTELVPAQQRGAYLALRNFTSQLTIAASAAACGFLYEHFGFRAICYFAAGFSLLAMFVAARTADPAERDGSTKVA
ncbi:MFS transporter [candidate division KSB1 bacterium]|nr:MAG: MFS transporter [candidate division KSB1 bacterium]MCE7940303.1 MFS transporter [Chlorobi bacterium CHB1]MDL1875714.1 MFS transporter [Cytophagia bacterium CHB2]